MQNFQDLKIGFIGLGKMGFPMAGHLSKIFDVKVFSRNPKIQLKWQKIYNPNKLQQTFITPSELAYDRDIICICVGDDNDVKEVLFSKNGVCSTLRPKSIIIDHTTTSAILAQEMFQKTNNKNISFLDAPVTGGQQGAENATLSIMVGGNKAIYQKTKSLLQVYAKKLIYIGAPGSGQQAKMINQICVAGVLAGLSEGLNLGKKLNLDLEKVLYAISGGAAQSWQMDNRAETMIKNKFDFGFAIDWMIKDLEIAFQQAKCVDLNLEISKIILNQYQKLSKHGYGKMDTSALIKNNLHNC